MKYVYKRTYKKSIYIKQYQQQALPITLIVTKGQKVAYATIN